MTTIAWDGTTLAADSLVCNGNTKEGQTDKIGRTEDGWLWAISGKMVRLEQFRDWAEKRDGEPPVAEGATCVLISPTGQPREWFDGGWCEIRAEFHVWGSGGDFALGAMAAGANAEAAARIGATLDINSGGDIKVLRREP